MSSAPSDSLPPFHRLLAFYAGRSNQPDKQTVRLYDSLTGNLALGLDFPVAVAIALGRHLYLRNSDSFFSLDVHIATVPRTLTPLDGLPVDEKASYSRADILTAARHYSDNRSGPSSGGLLQRVALQAEAMGLWALAADVHTGRLSGADISAFQRGTLFETLAARRRDRSQVLPLWRGGPISVAGHSWAVDRFFGVRVYLDPNTAGKGD